MKPAYSITDLGTLPGGSMSKAEALNNRGQVVGWGGYPDSPFRWAAWLWQEGRLSALAMPDEHLTSVAKGVNDLGQIIGETKLSVGDHNVRDEGGLKALSVGPGGTRLGGRGVTPGPPFVVRDGRAEYFVLSGVGRVLLRAINGKGHILGWIDTLHRSEPDQPPRKVRQSFLWDDGKLTNITAHHGGRFQAYALNDVGQVVGTAAGGAWNHAWLWENGQMTDLGTLGGYSIPHAINAAGQVVGVSQSREDGEDIPVHGFLWENGMLISLDGGAEERASAPQSINGAGQVVGSFSKDENSPIHGFLWEEGEMFDLNDLVAGISGWEITDAVGINDVGLIACNGNRDGEQHGLLLMPL